MKTIEIVRNRKIHVHKMFKQVMNLKDIQKRNEWDRDDRDW